jgi:upstream activation factor subunit UAF30
MSKETEPKKSAFMKPVQPDAVLAKIVGSAPLPRTEITKKIWEYIRKHNLQDPKDKKVINADANLEALFGGKKSADMFALTRFVNEHIVK